MPLVVAHIAKQRNRRRAIRNVKSLARSVLGAQRGAATRGQHQAKAEARQANKRSNWRH